MHQHRFVYIFTKIDRIFTTARSIERGIANGDKPSPFPIEFDLDSVKAFTVFLRALRDSGKRVKLITISSWRHALGFNEFFNESFKKFGMPPIVSIESNDQDEVPIGLGVMTFLKKRLRYVDDWFVLENNNDDIATYNRRDRVVHVDDGFNDNVALKIFGMIELPKKKLEAKQFSFHWI